MNGFGIINILLLFMLGNEIIFVIRRIIKIDTIAKRLEEILFLQKLDM